MSKAASTGRLAAGQEGREDPHLTPERAYFDASVLLVDDIEANLLALDAVLRPLRCNLVRASSGEEALRQVLLREFAVLLIDVMMPGLDGLATAQLIRSRASTRHVPIIFLTGMDLDARSMAQGYARGAVDYLVKPFDPDILRSKVAVFVELFLKNQELKAQTDLAKRREREALENRRLYESERGARTQAEAVSRAREEAIAIVSHDLRNPISSIAANVDALKRKLQHRDPDGLMGRVEAVQRGIARMNSLVSDLLDTARIQAGSLSIAPHVEDVVAIVRQAGDLLQPLLAEKQQHLDLRGPGHVLSAHCDRERVLQVLSNLVGNAIKFSPAEATITVEVSARANEVLVLVSDRGPGILAEQIPRIFEPYWQAAQERRQGLGLGLAIAKGIVEAHGTRIWAESQPGLGSQFFFTLPLARPPR
jgi:signal transduction histidine kinase